MKNIKNAFANITNIQKIRIAGTVTNNVTSTDKDINARNGMMNTALGLLAKGDLNCAGPAINPKTDLFSGNANTSTTTTTDIHKAPRKPGEIVPGVVLTEAEKNKIEEDLQRRIREAEEARQREEEAAKSAAATAKKKNNWMSRAAKAFGDFTSKIISEETEEDDKR